MAQMHVTGVKRLGQHFSTCQTRCKRDTGRDRSQQGHPEATDRKKGMCRHLGVRAAQRAEEASGGIWNTPVLAHRNRIPHPIGQGLLGAGQKPPLPSHWTRSCPRNPRGQLGFGGPGSASPRTPQHFFGHPETDPRDGLVRTASTWSPHISA